MAEGVQRHPTVARREGQARPPASGRSLKRAGLWIRLVAPMPLRGLLAWHAMRGPNVPSPQAGTSYRLRRTASRSRRTRWGREALAQLVKIKIHVCTKTGRGAATRGGGGSAPIRLPPMCHPRSLDDWPPRLISMLQKRSIPQGSAGSGGPHRCPARRSGCSCACRPGPAPWRRSIPRSRCAAA